MLSQEYFYTVEPIKKKASKEEFQTFLNNYPRKLTYDWAGIFEPPVISYNDFELANRRKLESLGYKVSAGSQYNESYFTISR
jgi:hypothetical protein